MFMQSIKLILDRINQDLSTLEDFINKNISLVKSNNQAKIKYLDKETLNQISHNLDKLDNIIKIIDEDD